MRKGIENCVWVKIVLTVVLIVVIVGIWCCKENCCFSDYRDFLPAYDSGVVVVQEDKSGSKSCTVTRYNTLEIYADKVSDNDTVYVYDSKNTINAGTLTKIGQKENIELRFMDAKAELIINKGKK